MLRITNCFKKVKLMIRSVFFSFFLLFYILNIYCQPKGGGISVEKQFEGSINFIKKTLDDTTFYVYRVKGRKIRIDIKENSLNSNSIENYLLFDLDKKSITAISPSRKLYIPIQASEYKKADEKKFIIVKSNNKKLVNGYQCFQWRVKNVEQKTEITYWVATENFAFFEDLLKLWNRSEKHAVFYLHEIYGYFPMESIERTLLRDEKMKLLVTSIQKTKVEDSLFNIPKDYKSYDQ